MSSTPTISGRRIPGKMLGKSKLLPPPPKPSQSKLATRQPVVCTVAGKPHYLEVGLDTIGTSMDIGWT